MMSMTDQFCRNCHHLKVTTNDGLLQVKCDHHLNNARQMPPDGSGWCGLWLVAGATPAKEVSRQQELSRRKKGGSWQVRQPGKVRPNRYQVCPLL